MTTVHDLTELSTGDELKFNLPVSIINKLTVKKLN